MIEAWRKIKEKQGVDFNVLFDKSDLDRWDHSDFALGLFSMSDMDYVRIHQMFLRFPNLQLKKLQRVFVFKNEQLCWHFFPILKTSTQQKNKTMKIFIEKIS